MHPNKLYRPMFLSLWVAGTWLAIHSLSAHGGEALLQDLPVIPDAPAPKVDYLIDSTSFKAEVGQSPSGRKLVMSNGLIRRSWRLAPNGACVAYDNLMNGQSMLRSVRPEARVTIDGVAYDVGGLVGQPNHAYLTTEWLDQMQADPSAMQLVGFEIGEPVERFAWNRRRHAAPDSTWPPKGVSLRMDYGIADHTGRDETASAFAREVLWADAFETLSQAWSVSKSDADPRTSFQNEGKAGEIYAFAHSHCFIERPINPNTALIEASINAGTDVSTSWGPGIAWAFENCVVKLNLRPGDRGGFGQFELRINGQEQLVSVEAFADKDGGLMMGHTYRLRIRKLGDQLIAEAAIDADSGVRYHELFTVSYQDPWGQSKAMRIGKMDRSGGASDEAAGLGPLVRLRVEHAAAYGPQDPAAVAEARAKLVVASEQESPVVVSVHYELYDGVPVMSKWIEVHNNSDRQITVDRFVGEELALVEHDNPVEIREGAPLTRPQYLHVETDFAFGSYNPDSANVHAVHWRPDPLYTTQVNYLKQTPCLLVCEPTYGPAQRIEPGQAFEGFRVFQLVHDQDERERQGLALRRMYRTIAPWVTENPLTHHLLANDPDTVMRAIDQAAEVGFEAVILTFFSSFNMENRDPAFLATWKKVADHAEAKGIELGSYALLSSRGVSAEHMIVSPPGMTPTHNQCPALTSPWGQDWLATIRGFYDATGFDQFENDGPYPGDVDITARPPLQQGIEDSRWVQFRLAADLYRDLREKGVYINSPDYYYLNGANKSTMGYREVTWSLPRAQQVIHTRQNIYDGTWQKTPSMGWMHVPLSAYHGGGPAATIEPLAEHLDHYEQMLRSNLGMGVQAHYRGPRLFDTQETKNMVKATVDWFKQYRDILESDIIHGRRADGRDLDWILHVNPRLENKGMLCVYNPLDHEVTRTLTVDLYYTGLTETASVSANGQPPVAYTLTRDYKIQITVTIPAKSMGWYVIE